MRIYKNDFRSYLLRTTWSPMFDACSKNACCQPFVALVVVVTAGLSAGLYRCFAVGAQKKDEDEAAVKELLISDGPEGGRSPEVQDAGMQTEIQSRPVVVTAATATAATQTENDEDSSRMYGGCSTRLYLKAKDIVDLTGNENQMIELTLP